MGGEFYITINNNEEDLVNDSPIIINTKYKNTTLYLNNITNNGFEWSDIDKKQYF